MNEIYPDGYHAIPPTRKGDGVSALQAWRGPDNTIKAFCHRLAGAEVMQASKFMIERSGQSERGPAVTGFPLGACYAPELAAANPETVSSAVVFYGTGPVNLSKSKADFPRHFGENDSLEPRSNIDCPETYLHKIGRPVTFYRYAGSTHRFFKPDRSQSYNAAAASLARERTLTFLKRFHSR